MIISIQSLYEKYKDNKTFFNNKIKYTKERNQEYYDLYNSKNELVCMDGEEIILVEHEIDAYIFHAINDVNPNSFFILSHEEYCLCVFN